ncbi:hypothetical protein D3C72_973020 [compost metagenome]
MPCVEKRHEARQGCLGLSCPGLGLQDVEAAVGGDREVEQRFLRRAWGEGGDPGEGDGSFAQCVLEKFRVEPQARDGLSGLTSSDDHAIAFSGLCVGEEIGIRAQPVGEGDQAAEGMLEGAGVRKGSHVVAECLRKPVHDLLEEASHSVDRIPLGVHLPE